jgi:dTDP-4-dehydrorhamnose reductase
MAGLDRSLVEPVAMGSLRRPAPRPRNSRLQCLLSPAIGLPEMPHWRDALREYISQSGEASLFQTI